jgi:UDPglucose--hexose-1-phosphate uridylyltransferase
MMSTESRRRFNPLTGDWVLVSTGRLSRPWSGALENPGTTASRVGYSDDCALCPGNSRAGGARNPDYNGVYVFDNDFPAFASRADADDDEEISGDLFKSQVEMGRCRVVCFSENHSLSLAQLDGDAVTSVFRTYRDETERLIDTEGIRHVQIFENRGEMMGCSNPHPHAQIWAQGQVPSFPAREAASMASYHQSHRCNLLLDYREKELCQRDRVVFDNGEFAVIVPYWAAWPFETIVIPRQPSCRLTDLDDASCEAFADAVRRISIRYDNLFRTDFPYSSGIHQYIGELAVDSAYQLHMHFFPPLLRSAQIRKYMVGYEMLAEPQRDLSPEEAASLLRDQSDVHYLEIGSAGP